MSGESTVEIGLLLPDVLGTYSEPATPRYWRNGCAGVALRPRYELSRLATSPRPVVRCICSVAARTRLSYSPQTGYVAMISYAGRWKPAR